jgi:hypothetical protein
MNGRQLRRADRRLAGFILMVRTATLIAALFCATVVVIVMIQAKQ